MNQRPSGYSILFYGDMVTCEPRMSSYADALRSAITPGCKVIDIGAGPGIFSILACKYGAGSVIAIDPDDSAALIMPTAQANGCADRITVVKDLSTKYSSDRKADVIISDIHGILPQFEYHIASIADARERLLGPGGKLIPARDIMRVALAYSPDDYRRYQHPWLTNKFGVDLSPAYRYVSNCFQKVNLGSDNLLSKPRDLAVIDYYSVTEPDMVGAVDLEAERAGIAQGYSVWFDAELGDGIGFSNEPGQPRLIYGQALFPFEQPVEVEPGDRVTGEISARMIDGLYFWNWRSSFFRAGQSRGIDFRQSTFLAKILDQQSLVRHSGSATPAPHSMHEVDQFCLSLFDGRQSLDDIAEQLRAKWPGVFDEPPAALNHAAALANRYQ